ncbi:pyruvate kinase [Solidesulfovibrio fructosivorans JJ]]|uniref:Pyruvate kinase n=1 Tax=Solidesulfovibrio fructosivorans JJ] TaxID=596151 RepID=E1JYJ1_SOLFR|nr:pyruvate kinase [Solidesulfovibrio fructosivorans]EFL50575.1 pyruvate kinase [Solidesulfovibrio fructosivorans JJ]]
MHTKIVATLGPASIALDTMREMVRHGVRIFRLNFSHADAAYFEPIIKNIRSLESEFGIPLTALGDLCGPKTRIGEVADSPRSVNKGESLLLGLPDERPDPAHDDRVFVSLDMPELLAGLRVGMPVNLSDGLLQFRVTREVKADRLYAMEAQNAGLLSSNKGIAFPGKHHALPALTAKDVKDLHEGIDVGVDALAISFVQNAEDVAMTKEEIKKHGVWVPVVSKLERQNAVENLDAILKLTDAVMVARGDLGLECPIPELPILQKKIIRACRHAQRPVIVATQMLLSMVKNPIPTRAESTDVANAILDGADCVMLSEETAVGDHVVETVKVMRQISDNALKYYLERIPSPYAPKREKNPGKFVAYSACLIADNMEADAIVCHSVSGTNVRLTSSRRPRQSIYGVTPDSRVMHFLNFAWGVHPRLLEATSGDHMARVEAFVQNCPDIKPGDPVVITAGRPTPGNDMPGTNEIKIYYK